MKIKILYRPKIIAKGGDLFKALDCQTKNHIVILDSLWNQETITPLRLKGKEGSLVCPVCKHEVIVKAGEKRLKRWHFAHKALGVCPLQNESPAILQARILLYNWLLAIFGKSVTIEKHFPGTDLPRPFDCYIETSAGDKFGYWILEKGLKSRYAIESTLWSLDIKVNWVFLYTMMRLDKENSRLIELSPTERDLMHLSEYNHLYGGGHALNYLDIENQTIVTTRGLSLFHLPKQYTFRTLIFSKLSKVRVSPKNGEFVHPGEHEELLEKKKIERLREEERKRKEEESRKISVKEREQRRVDLKETQNKNIYYNKNNQKVINPAPNKTPVNSNKTTEKCDFITPSNDICENYREYVCKVCGCATKDWVVFDMKDGSCICSQKCLGTKRLKRFEDLS